MFKTAKKTAKNEDDAFGKFEKLEAIPHGWIQFKGTSVCMDVHCECGEMTHIDADHCYVVECSVCKRQYAVGGFVELIRLEEPSNRAMQTIY